MKMFNKVLAVFLSLMMLLTVIPVAAFASTPFGDAPDKKTPVNDEVTVTLTTPDPTGTGVDGTIIFHLDAAAIVNALRSDGDLVTALKQVIREMIDRTETDVITVNDLLELVPMENILKALLGSDNENVPALIEQLGGMAAVMELLDTEQLILSADRAELVNFITSLENVTAYIYAEKLFRMGIAFDLEVAFEYVDQTVLKEKIQTLTFEQIKGLTGGDFDRLKQIVDDYDALIQDLLAQNLINLSTDIDIDALKQNNIIIDALTEKLKTDYEEILTEAGMTKLEDRILALVETLVLSEADFKDAESFAELIIGDDDISDLITAEGELDFDKFLQRYQSEILALVKADANSYIKEGTATQYVQESTVDAIRDSVIAGLGYNDFEADDYHQSVLTEFVLDVAKKNDIDLAVYLKPDFNPFAVSGAVDLIMDRIDWDALRDTVDPGELLELLLGDDSLDTLIPPENFQAFLADERVKPTLNSVFDKIASNEYSLNDIVDVNGLVQNGIPSSKYGELIGLFNRQELINQLKPHAVTLARKLNKEQIKSIVVPMLSVLVQNIDLVSLDGYTVAQECTGDSETPGMLALNYEELAKALISLIPTFTDIAECEDGKILSFNLYVEYVTVSNEKRTKDINIEVILGGREMGALRKLAGKLAQYISVSRNGNQLSVELTMPYAVTKAFAKILNSDRYASLKQELLALADKDGADLVEILDRLTLDQILGLLSRIDIEELYSTIMNISQVETVLEILIEKTGLDCSIETLQDLNAVLDAIANGVPTFEAVCDAIERKTKFDVMKILEKTASFADRNATIQAFLDRLSTVPYIGSLLNEHSFTEILENYKDVDPVEAVSDFVAKRVNVNLLELLQNYDANEIYQKALERAAGYEAQYNRVKSFALRVLDPDYVPQSRWEKLAKALIPESVLRKFLSSSLTNAYKGNGSFSVSEENITLDIGAWCEKALELIFEHIPVDETVRNMLEGFIPHASVNFGLSVKVNFQSIYEVTYLDENGEKLLTTYLPAGIDPSVALKAPAVAGKEFLYWADANGNAVTSVSGDCVLRAHYNQDIYTVRFEDADGNLLGEFPVIKGDRIPSVPAVPSAEELGLINGKFTPVWYLGDTAVTVDEILEIVVTSNLTFVFRYEKEPGSEFFGADGADLTVEKDAHGNWKVTINGSDFALNINLKNGDLKAINSLTVKAGDVQMKLDNAVLSQLANASKADSVISLSSKYGTEEDVSLKTKLYEYKTKDAYSFDLTVDGKAFHENFAGKFEITLPYADAIESGRGDSKTVIYVLGADGAEVVEATVTPGVGVTFAAPHFSNYLIVNEYLVSGAFVDTDGNAIGGMLNLTGMMIPAGARIFQVIPSLTSDNAYGNVIKTISYTDETGATRQIARIGDEMIMPACAVTVTSVVGKLTFHTYYVVGDQIFTNQAEADAAILANTALIPLGYRLDAGKWIGQDSATAEGDVYLTPKFDAITYTLKFEGSSDAVTFTIENYASQLVIPAVPEVAGKTGTWKNLESDPLKLIKSMADQGVTELTVSAEYKNRTYQVFFPDQTVDAEFGSSVQVNIQARPGYTLKSVVWVNLDNGTETAVSGNAFTMPAANVRVVAVEIPNTIHFAIVNQNNGNKTELTADFGTYASFTVQIPKNAVLELVPSVGKLVSFKVNEDGSKTLVYSFPVTAEIADNTEISYRTSVKVPTQVRLANGLVTNEDAPVSSVKGLTFAGFVTPEGAKFDSTEIQIANYQQPEVKKSLTWLWILIVVVVLIALIALLYVLHIHGKVKSNFIIRFVVWIVTLFFNICLGISGLVLLITQGTKKKEEIDFNAFGMANPVPADGDGSAVSGMNAEPVNAEDASSEAENSEAENSEADGNEAENSENEVAEVTEETEETEVVADDVTEEVEGETTVAEEATEVVPETEDAENAENTDADADSSEDERR